MNTLQKMLLIGLLSTVTLALALIVVAEEPNLPQGDLTKPEGIDLDVTYISRVPLHHRYDVRYTSDQKPYLALGTEDDQRWPAYGEVVTFTAHVMNKGPVASGAFDVAWSIDGAVVATGTLPSLDPGAEITATYAWTWQHTVVDERLEGEHTVAFEVDPDDLIDETYETNNRLEDRTDALSLRLTLTPDLYDALEIPVDPQWPFSAEDWLQKQIAAMNAAFERSTYPAAPQGIEERVRLDQILITESPAADVHVDGSFHMRADDRYGNAYYHAATDVSGALIHELTHQLGIIDTYNLNVALEIPQVLDRNGNPVQLEYWPELPGLMGNAGIDPPSYSEHTALALNAHQGYRRGYYGEYLYDVPPTVTLYLLNSNATPASDVTVRFFQPAPYPNVLGSRHGSIDNVPEITVTTDALGRAVLPNRDVGDPVSTRTGHTLEDNPFGVINVVGKYDEFLVEITTDDHQEYQWLDITTFNLLDWRGEDRLTLATNVPPPTAPAPPVPVTGTQAYGQVALSWAPSPSATTNAYHVYRTTGPTYAWRRVVTGTAALNVILPYAYNWRAAGYAVTAVDGSGRESGFGDLFWALRLRHPADLVVRDDGQRLVLDPQNGYALLLQTAEDEYVDTLGSFDLHLEHSQYLTRDPMGRLLVSHPGDWYSTRHSVRVLHPDANLLFEFGQRGSGDGEFQTPAGVTTWIGPAMSPAHPPPIYYLVADSGNHRLQAFGMGGEFVTAYGSPGTALGQFNNPQGLTTLPSGEIVVVDSGNHRLQVLTFDGTTFTPVRQLTADFDAPSDVASYGSDHLIVADQGNDAVKVLAVGGADYATYTAPDASYGGTFNRPHGVAVDLYGRILVADTDNRRVVAISDALPALPPTALTVEGPGVGTRDTIYTYTALVEPGDATLPLTYTWRATDHAPVTRTVAAYTDTLAFTWGVSGTKHITVTAANDGGAVTGTRTVLVDPPYAVHLPLVLRSYAPKPVILSFRADVEIADPGETIRLEWESAGATGGTLYHLLPSGQFGEFWSVEPSGFLLYTISESRRNSDRFYLYVYDDAGHDDATFEIPLTCPDTWFFEPAPDICPSGPAVYSSGAEQHFEHGVMLWVQSEDRIYVLYDEGIPAWQAFTDEWEEGDPVKDDDIVPPPGYYQPERGFGLVWREQPNVRERLGWGTTPEAGGQTAVQRTSHWKYVHTFIKALIQDGTWHLEPERSGWEYVP